jgi:hypothetical protein
VLSIRLFASAALLSFLLTALAGCGGGGSGTGSTGGTGGSTGTGGSGGSGGSGGGSSFQPRPFPGDYFVTAPETEYKSFPGNVVYDSKHKEFFFSNLDMNEVEAYSTVDGRRVGAVNVPGPMGLSLSPDNSELAVGTISSQVYFVDPAVLHITGKAEIPASLLDPSSKVKAVLPFLMSSGPMLIGAAETVNLSNGTGDGILISYDRKTGTFAQMNGPAEAPGFYTSLPARSLDGKYLAVSTPGLTKVQMAVYSAESQTYIGTTAGQFIIGAFAVNADGSQFATIGTPSYTSPGQAITFWNRSLQQVAQYPIQDTTPYTSIVYSRDGKYLYAREVYDVLALDTRTGLPAGYQGLSTPTRGHLWDTDESNRVYGIAYLGAYVVSVAQLQSTAPVMPYFSDGTWPVGNPNLGPLPGGTDVQFAATLPVSSAGSANGIRSSTEAYFGLIPATKDVVAPNPYSSDGGNAITATSAAATSTGNVTVLLTDANNNAVLLPRGYSYGTRPRWVEPSALPSGGGAGIEIGADGVLTLPGVDPPVGVTIGGARAIVVPPKGSGFWQLVHATTPPGKPGWADLTMSLPDGTTETAKNMVQYLAQDVTLTTAAYTSAVYDASRDLFYLTGADSTVGVFDPKTRALLQPMQSSTISSGAALGSLAITPDSSKLLVTDPADHSLVMFDLTSGKSSAVNLLVASDGATKVSAPMPVVTVAGDRAIVVLSGWTQNEVREIDLAQRTVRVRADVTSAGSFHDVPSTMASSSDGSTALLGGGDGLYLYVWKYDASSDTFSGPMGITSAFSVGVAVNADGKVLEMGRFTLEQNLSALVPFLMPSQINMLTASGGLRYSAYSGVEIEDTRNGRSLLSMGSLPDVVRALAIDPGGHKILACSDTLLRYYELAVVPLAVGTVSPEVAASGASITIHGDGFVAGTAVTIAGQGASCTMVDEHTLQCTVPHISAGLAPMTLSNPDGQTYSFEAAVNVQ